MKLIKVLLVEDNEGDILLTKEALEGIDCIYSISVLRDGKEVITFFDEVENTNEVPDLILLDIFLPKKNGHEVLEYLRQSEKYKDIPVIMLTMSSAEKDILLSYRHYANYYITKPIDVDEFVQAVGVLKLLS